MGWVVLAFAAGFFLEGSATWWVEVVEQHRAKTAGLLASLFALAQVTGLEQALRSRPAEAAFVVGYGVGSWAAVRFPLSRLVRRGHEAQGGGGR